MIEQANRYELRNRYQFTGRLVMQTALHIGGGKVTLSSSDSPIVLTPERVPFVPGSSFKGALRSTVEKLVPSLPDAAGMFSCGLIELSEEDQLKEKKATDQVCSTSRPKYFTNKRRKNPAKEKEIIQEAIDNLCHTCQLSGSPFAASHINVNDLYMNNSEWNGVIQMRDGVAIDRDSEKARDRLKYDFEVVPASAAFNLEITLENATAQDLQILSAGLSEFVHGFGAIGGKRSRGLGACRLVDLQVSALELTGIAEGERNRRLRDYLLRREFSLVESGEKFLERHIASIF